MTEFAGFNGVMCAYFAAIGKLDTAKLLYKALVEVAPDSELTRFLLRFMYPSTTGKLEKLMKLLRLLKRVSVHPLHEISSPCGRRLG